MTDRDWRNARIEEAAKMISEFAASNGPVDAFHTAKVLVSMFEKALGEAPVTPTVAEGTSDEREALARLLDHRINPASGDGMTNPWWLADVILAAGFRRSGVPEPSAFDFVKYEQDHGREPEPQGEPSTHDDGCEADWGPEGQESPCRCAERAKGEPSDAPSDADLDAARAEIAARMNYKIGPTRDAMRAALRAANNIR